MGSVISTLDPPMVDDFAEMSDEGLARAIRSWGMKRAAADKEITVRVEELARRRRGPATGIVSGEFDPGGDKSIRDEVAVILRTNPGAAGTILETGFGLRRLPLVREAFGSALTADQVHAVTASLADVDDDVAARLEAGMVEYALTHDGPTDIRDTGRRRVARADPDGAARRREKKVQARDVTVRPTADGMAWLSALLPILAGAQILDRLREMALTQACGRDLRSHAQRRADALIALCLGDGRLHCGCGRGDCSATPGLDEPVKESAGPVVHVGISDATLLRLRDDPALLEGFGAIDADLARRITRMPGARLIPIPETCPDNHDPGGDVGEARRQAEREWRYRPSAEVDRWVRAIDGSCRGPNCPGGAHHGDLDHIRPYDHRDPSRGGKTHSSNLAVACRSTHGIKTAGDNAEGGWRVRMVDGDRRTMEWTTPSGVTTMTEPQGRRYLFPHTETPDEQRPSA